eukprot:SAG11_NODE_300_length_11057_cov_5.223469_15_plen_100_part_00
MVALNLSDSQISAQSAGRSGPLSEPGALTEATALLQTLILPQTSSGLDCCELHSRMHCAHAGAERKKTHLKEAFVVQVAAKSVTVDKLAKRVTDPWMGM